MGEIIILPCLLSIFAPVTGRNFTWLTSFVRFISLPVAEMKGKLETQIKELEGDVEGLGKRLHYLEVSQKNSKDQIDRMLRGGAGAS